MPNPSPYDLYQKAAQHVTSADRWATLKHNAQERIPVAAAPLPEQAPQQIPQPAPYYAPQPEKPQTPPAANPAQPQLLQPPFPPPQPRHPFLDEIGKRHNQAIKTALKPQEWQPGGQASPAATVREPNIPNASKE